MSSRRPERPVGLWRAAGFRLALSYSIFFTIACGSILGLVYFLLSSSLAKRDHDDILYKFWDLAGSYQAFEKDGLESAIDLQTQRREGRPYFVQFALPGQAEPTRYLRGQWKDFDLSPLGGLGEAIGERWLVIKAREGPARLEVLSQRLSDGLLLQVGQTDDERRELLIRFGRIVTAIMALALLISLPGGYLLARRALAPVRALIATIRRIEAGAVGQRVPIVGSGDEFDELGVLFNGMQARIETLIAGMKGALDNVAHDLRTPLTRLMAGAEQALVAGADLEATRGALADCVEESERVVGMVETLMDISEAETGLLKLKLQDVDLSALAKEAAEIYRYIAEEKGVAIELSTGGPVMVRADRNRLRQVAANLLDNAVKYTPRSGKILLETSLLDGQAVFAVSDTGPGVPVADQPKVWDRLYRGDASRSQRGLGLGLSLVKAVVAAHQGEVALESDPGKGARFSCRLPVA